LVDAFGYGLGLSETYVGQTEAKRKLGGVVVVIPTQERNQKKEEGNGIALVGFLVYWVKPI
jgi:hypothetical protein